MLIFAGNNLKSLSYKKQAGEVELEVEVNILVTVAWF